ncbi:MAG: hypothetical protein AB1758_23920 [Candidatus Eremiobacterota bacterium]
MEWASEAYPLCAQRLLGHLRLSSLQHYVNPTRDDLAAAVAAIE